MFCSLSSSVSLKKPMKMSPGEDKKIYIFFPSNFMVPVAGSLNPFYSLADRMPHR